MKKYLILLLVPFLIGAAPTRPNNYSAGDTILSSEVNADFNALYNYTTAGIDTIKDGSIVNADISGSANIQSDKLNLTAIAQQVSISGVLDLGKGSDIASASSITLGTDGNYFDITGTTNIATITAKSAGTIVILQFDGILDVVETGNLILSATFTTSADDTLMLISNGVSYHELSRSAN